MSLTTRISFFINDNNKYAAAAVLFAFSILCSLGISLAGPAPKAGATGGKIIFVSDSAVSTVSDIYTMNPDGSDIVNLTNTSNVSEHAPEVSPDGSKVLYEKVVHDGTTSQIELFTMNIDGTDHTRLTYGAGKFSARGSWSPDGSQIAFTSNRGTSFSSPKVFTMNADGSNITDISKSSINDSWDHPDWALNGKIYFVYRTATSYTDIWSMNSDGSGKTNVTSNSGINEYNPEVSPDGSKIVFQVATGGVNQAEIFAVNIDGSSFTAVSNSPYQETQPAWSPDGNQIAFYSNKITNGGSTHVFTMNADGSNQANPQSTYYKINQYGPTEVSWYLPGGTPPPALDANNDQYSVVQGTTLNNSVTTNDVVEGGTTATTSLVTGPQSGALQLNPNGTFSYTPNAAYVGNDGFTYRLTDNLGRTDVASVNITVSAANRAPAANFTFVKLKRPANTISFTNTSTDPDGDSMTYLWNFGDGTTSTATSPTRTYTIPKGARTYSVNVTLTATDSKGASHSVTKTVVVK